MVKQHIIELEEQLAYLSRTVDELNEVVTTQTTEIQVLTRRVRMLMERMADEELATSNSAPLADQKPPHW